MASIEVKRFESPDETRVFAGLGKADVVEVGGRTVGRAQYEPGWRWSANVKPIAGTDHCETAHLGYCVAGRMHVWMTDGNEAEMGAGDVVAIPAGHDAEVVGDEACVFIDFGQYADYATPP